MIAPMFIVLYTVVRATEDIHVETYCLIGNDNTADK